MFSLGGLTIKSFFSSRIQQFPLYLQVYFGCCSFTGVNSLLPTDNGALVVFIVLVR